MRPLLLIAPLLILAGCVTMNLPLSVIVKETNGEKLTVQVMGDEVRPYHIGTIIEALDYLPIQMLRAKPAFHVRDDKHLGTAVAHQCWVPFRKVCIRPEYVRHKTIWHECMHVYETGGDSRVKRLVGKWDELAGDVYHKNYPAGEGASEGLITDYSRNGADEDRAEFFACCMAYVHLNHHLYFMSNSYLKTDGRYRQKLELLRAADIFTEEQYQKLKPLFQ